jgi:hypothetical protein
MQVTANLAHSTKTNRWRKARHRLAFNLPQSGRNVRQSAGAKELEF